VTNDDHWDLLVSVIFCIGIECLERARSFK